MPVTFAMLRKNYPTSAKEELFKALGGDWPKLVADPAYKNTCAVRISVALKKSGVAIPTPFKEAIEGDGSPLVLKVKTMSRLVTELFGPSTWGMSKPPGGPFDLGNVPQETGIIAYHVDWKDATGHFDLWTGFGFIGEGDAAGVIDGHQIELWAIA